MIMTCCLVESWNEVIFIKTKCQGTGVEKGPQTKNTNKKRTQGGANLTL